MPEHPSAGFSLGQDCPDGFWDEWIFWPRVGLCGLVWWVCLASCLFYRWDYEEEAAWKNRHQFKSGKKLKSKLPRSCAIGRFLSCYSSSVTTMDWPAFQNFYSPKFRFCLCRCFLSRASLPWLPVKSSISKVSSLRFKWNLFLAFYFLKVPNFVQAPQQLSVSRVIA